MSSTGDSYIARAVVSEGREFMPRNVTVFLSAVLLLVSGITARAESVYKCRNPQGDLIYQGTPCAKSAQPVSSWNAPAEVPQSDSKAENATNGVLVLKQHGNGHYLLNGTVNGKALTFVIDTGASVVSLPRQVAMSAQIYCKDQVLMQTANGQTNACTAIIPRLQFGPFTIKDAPAIIAPNLSQPLLGMNVLRHFKIEQENGEMRISVR